MKNSRQVGDAPVYFRGHRPKRVQSLASPCDAGSRGDDVAGGRLLGGPNVGREGPLAFWSSLHRRPVGAWPARTAKSSDRVALT